MQVGDKVKIVAEGSRGSAAYIGREGKIIHADPLTVEYRLLVDIDLQPQWSHTMAYFDEHHLEVVCN